MTPEPQTAALLKALEEMGAGADRDLGAADIAATRAASEAMWQPFASEDHIGCAIRHLTIPGPAGAVPARLYRPENSEGRLLPLVLFLHGGGWSLGSLESYEPLVKALCAGSDAAFLSVDYRLAPEHPYPAGLEDAKSALFFAVKEADRLGIDRTRTGIMGDSAGGNLAAVIARRLRADLLVRLKAQFLIYPVLDVASPHGAYPSRQHFGDGGYLLSRRDIEVTTDWYLGGRHRADDPDISPLLATDFHGLPPTVLLTAGLDPLTDEARRYRELLIDAGVPVEMRCFEHTIHAFLSLGILDVSQAARAWLSDRVRILLR